MIALFFQNIFKIRTRDLFVVHHENMKRTGIKQYPHCQKFENTIPDMLQSVMLGSEDGFGPLDIQIIIGCMCPGQRCQKFDIAQSNAILRRRRVGLIQPIQLFHRYFGNGFRKLSPDGNPQLVNIRFRQGCLFLCLFRFFKKNHPIPLSGVAF